MNPPVLLSPKTKSFTDISAWVSRPVAMDMDDGTPRMVGASFISGNSLEVMGIYAYLGRLLTPADDVPGGPAEGWPVVLSHGFWKDTFGGDPSIVGKQTKLSNAIVAVVGVGPANFRGVSPGSETKVYLPMQFFPVVIGTNINAPDSLVWCNPIARLS